MSYCGRITAYLPYCNKRSMRPVNTTLKVWTWQVQVSGYHDSNSSLRSTKWIVRVIQLERNSIKQRAIQHAFKWNKFQFSPTTDAQRTVKWALWFYITLSSPFSYPLISSTLLWLKLLWPQLFIFVWLCLCFLSCDSLILHTHCMTQQTAPRDVCVDQIGRWPMVMEVDN